MVLEFLNRRKYSNIFGVFLGQLGIWLSMPWVYGVTHDTSSDDRLLYMYMAKITVEAPTTNYYRLALFLKN